VIANELTTKTEFLTLTFGLTDGWWLFEDAERRIPGAPLLSRCGALLAVTHGAVPSCAAPRVAGYQGLCRAPRLNSDSAASGES
jgi:hypothetical protein